MAAVDADRYVMGFGQVDRSLIAAVGGKGANLGELTRIPGIEVPPGFCVTTAAFRRLIGRARSLEPYLDRLDRLVVGDRDGIQGVSAEIRTVLEATAMPSEIAMAVTAAVDRLGSHAAYAIRSSATAEDLPAASFAGQHDSYLNVVGAEAILQHVSRCWASLFTERAVTYRLRHRIDHRHVLMGVVVQRMVAAEAAGVAFTADPLTSNRKVVSVEAAVGLGEALVSGRVTPDVYKVREGHIVEAVRQERPALADEEVIRLAGIARRIEAHFGAPQDIEWCRFDGTFPIVQSRAITTLFPIPERDDAENHVYVSVGHQQMMTDPMRPLGLSVWRLTSLASMHVAGGRLFVDVTERLAVPESRAGLLAVFGRGDPLIRDAMETVIDREDFLPGRPADAPVPRPPGGPPATIPTDPAIVDDLMARAQASIARLERDIQTKEGLDLLEFIRSDVPELRRILFDPESQQAIMAGMEATWWLNDQLEEWLGEKGAADVLSRSAPNNVTAEMGLALLDVADVIRPFPDVIEYLPKADDGFLDDEALARRPGGTEAQGAIRSFLDRYGMRCVGEIDITRPRWSEQPAALVPLLLGNIKSFDPGEAERRFEQGKRDAEDKEIDILDRLRDLPEGDEKAAETKAMIDRVRTFVGYREYPKYGMVRRYFVYKRALLREAERLEQTQVLRDRTDIFFLAFDELRDVVQSGRVDEALIQKRREEFASYGALTPPRVLTSEGEAIAGSYRRHDLPPGALVGLAVSAGTIEGRARVILDLADAQVEEGDILVTAYTDPSWSPLFVAVKGLVTEVGGLMTHGAVIAREYGLPAVVGVEQATQLIQDGRMIRLHGTDGYVELL